MGTAYANLSLYKRILDRQVRMETDKSPWVKSQERIAEYTRPDLNTSIDSKGQFITSTNVVDGGPAYYGLVMARGMIANLVSATSDWRKYQVQEEELRGDDQINKWCQTIDNIMADAYRESNYYDILHQYALTGVTVGSPIVIAEEDGGKIAFTVPHYKQAWLARDWFGRDLALHIKYKCSALEISRDFASADHLFPLSFKQAMEDGSHWGEWEILQAFYRIDDPIFEGRSSGDVEIMRHRPWVCLWILTSADQPENQEPIRIRYYRMQPFSAWHYHRNQGETYARTPAWFGMTDVLGSQMALKSQYQLAELKARPPIWTLARVKALLDRRPGATNAVPSDMWQYKPEVFGAEGDYLTAKDFWERLDQSCRRWFLVDFFLMLNQLVARGQGPPTATQIIGMNAEQITQVVGAVQGIERQFLTPNDERVFEILNNAGAFPRPPDRYLYYGSGKLTPVFQGPLAQAQRRYMSLQRLNMALAASAPLFTLDENSRFKLRIPDMVERIFEESGVWQDTLVGKREYEDILDAIAQRNDQAMQFAAGQATANTIKQLQGPTDPSSPLAQMVTA